jgi:phosphatidylserine/phosphatidylglycerophosphate/cardiolipin synthase-like enzyme
VQAQEGQGRPELTFLTDGGQDAQATADLLIAFIDAARASLDIAIYDAHLVDGLAAQLLHALDAAEARGVRVRAVYNDDHRGGPEAGMPSPPPQGPSLLARLSASVPSTAIPGIPDLMHHKYMIRDAEVVWTGSTNWTDDAWSHMENLIVTFPSPDLAAAYTEDFEQLWERRHVHNTGTFDDLPAHDVSFGGEALGVRVLFSPGRGRALGRLVARRIAEARHRIRICSPVITSGPVLQALMPVLAAGNCDARITVDAPQIGQALEHWHHDERVSWKVPLLEQVRASKNVAQKHSRPYQAGPPNNYMHAKIVVCDDIVLTGSYNLSHSGELNAENVVEVTNAHMADACAAYCEQVYDRYR